MTALEKLSPEKQRRFQELSDMQRTGATLDDDKLKELIALCAELRRTTSGPAKPRTSRKKAEPLNLSDI